MEDTEILEKLFYDDESFEPNGYIEIYFHKQEQDAIKNLIARNKELENRFLEIIINGKPLKIKNDVKQLAYTDFGNNEFTLEVLEKWK